MLILADMLILPRGGGGLPLDYELERWTRVGHVRRMRSRNGRLGKADPMFGARCAARLGFPLAFRGARIAAVIAEQQVHGLLGDAVD